MRVITQTERDGRRRARRTGGAKAQARSVSSYRTNVEGRRSRVWLWVPSTRGCARRVSTDRSIAAWRGAASPAHSRRDANSYPCPPLAFTDHYHTQKVRPKRPHTLSTIAAQPDRPDQPRCGVQARNTPTSSLQPVSARAPAAPCICSPQAWQLQQRRPS